MSTLFKSAHSGVDPGAVSRGRHDGIAGTAEPETVEIVCECGHGCGGRIVLPVTEYVKVRRHPARFFVKAGHEVSQTHRVVGDAADYVVIETRTGFDPAAINLQPFVAWREGSFQ